MVLLTQTNQRPDAVISQAIGDAILSAEQEFSPLKFEGEYPDNGIGISVLRPRHVIAQDYWQMSVTTSFANWINKTLGTNVFLIVTGLMNNTLDPQVVELFPTANGKDLPYMNIENLYSVPESRGWLTKPFVISPNNNLTIQAIGRQAQTERLGLLGYSLARRSFLITASP